MGGQPQAQPEFLTVLNLNATVPADHPLRAIKRHVDAVLQKLSPRFDELYKQDGRPSIPPEPLLKAHGKEARLCFGAHILMENRNGLCVDFTLHNPITEPEPVMALRQLQAHQTRHEGVRVKTVGADKAYHRKDFVAGCRKHNIAPHVARKEGVSVPGLDGRTTTKESYRLSQKIRKRVEEIIGWIKTVGGLRRSRYRGRERTQAWGYFVAGTYNLLRMARLSLSLAGAR